MHAVATNKIADILYFNDKGQYKAVESCKYNRQIMK